MEFEGKVFVLTGAAAGIGREVAKQLLQEGAKIVALDINEEALNNFKKDFEEYKKDIYTQKLDITSKIEVEALPEQVLKTFGQIDGIFNIAGIIQPFISVDKLSYQQINRVFDINFYGTLYVIKAFLPYLLKNSTTSYIVNVSSMGGFLPVPGQSVYGASKAAVKLLTEGLYAELKNTNVRVSIVFPGAVATDITKNSNVEIKMSKDNQKSKFKALHPSRAAQIILKGVKKEKFRIIVGKDAKIMDILYRLNPKYAVNLILKKMKNLIN